VIFVVDASIVVKLAVIEDGRDEIRSLLSNEADVVVAPDWMLLEVANALWRKWRMKEIEALQAREAMAHVLRSFPNLVPARDLAERALQLAIELDHPAYDCAYLACAPESSGTLVTSDRRRMSAAAKGGYSAMVHPIGAHL
jgi:predicted nucleic acid-binding protein